MFGKALSVAFQSNDRKEIRKFIDKIYPDISKIKGLVNLTKNPDNDKGTEYKVDIQDQTLAKLGLDFKAVGPHT